MSLWPLWPSWPLLPSWPLWPLAQTLRVLEKPREKPVHQMAFIDIYRLSGQDQYCTWNRKHGVSTGTSMSWLSQMVTLRNSEFRSHSLGHSLQIVKQVSVDVLFPHDGDTLKNSPIHKQFLPPRCNIYQLLAHCMIIWGMLPLQWSNTHTIQGCLSFFSPMPICISMQTDTLNIIKHILHGFNDRHSI